MTRPARIVTTVRFDVDLWERLGTLAAYRGVARAELVRDAAREHVVRLEQRDRLAQLDRSTRELAEMQHLLETRVESIARVLDAVVRETRALVQRNRLVRHGAVAGGGSSGPRP
ncbi:ribbon-helix-helix domain-containing protein [Conexibacter woesei]|uniref:Uncharacterized protein n=1 Tax=Conexibacter woesei (strain DSM 14684 / CCUG 47730 / CIP 108061 / JCM 11494 / NBRC 100937 / ID131577) TaxID=469383 RepID=D3FEB5_CONWI|nr:CopG family transcriptional regulator [Conexibacter woesei]ADB53607.1 hypothetical protein Cwoe_5199 [Conexibacter woesei DSM 14684]